MALGLDHPIGLFALASLIPLIILYLIKPKPTNLPIPSLLFFIKRSKISKKNKILRHFQNELLFYIQLLTLFFLALVIMQPYLTRTKDLASDNKIFILDVSASSQVLEGDKIRFELAQEKINTLATSGKNTLILAKNTPLVALQNAQKTDFLRYLKTIKPSEEETALGDAILLGGELIKEKGRVIVLSDFINTKGISPQRAKNTLEGKGIAVDFINTALTPRKNIGIINLVVDDQFTTVYVKNYAQEPVTVPLLVNTKLTTTLTIKPGNTEPYSFPTVDGVAEIKLDIIDDFPVDNIVYANTPDDRVINVLYITNNPSKFVQSALTANDHVRVTIAQPPIIPKEPYDIYIIHNIQPVNILPGSFEDIAKTIREKGGAAIVHAQDTILIDYKDLAPITITNITTGGAITTDHINRFTRDVDFGATKRVYQGTTKGNPVIFARVNATPILALQELGKGKIFYYGILESESEFKISPGYPVFWVNLIKYLKGQQDLRDINLKTGTTFLSDNGDQLILDKTGVYTLPSGRIAVNLLNDKESTINPEETTGNEITQYIIEPVKDTDKRTYQVPILLILLALVLFEMIYIKIRGEV